MFTDYELYSISIQCYCEVTFWSSHCELSYGPYHMMDHIISDGPYDVCISYSLWNRPLNTVLFSGDIVVIEIRTRVRLDTIILTVTFVIKYSYFTSKDFHTQCLWSISYAAYVHLEFALFGYELTILI